VDLRELPRIGLGRQEEINEAGAGHLGARHQGISRQRGDDRLRQLTGIAASGLGQAQRDVRGEVAMLGVASPLDGKGRWLGCLGENAAHQSAHGAQQELLELLLQGIDSGKGPVAAWFMGPAV
jgi:hypothetical protein